MAPAVVAVVLNVVAVGFMAQVDRVAMFSSRSCESIDVNPLLLHKIIIAETLVSIFGASRTLRLLTSASRLALAACQASAVPRSLEPIPPQPQNNP